MSKNYPLKASLNTNSFEKLREMAKVNNDTPSNLLRSILDKLDKGEFDKALEPYQPQKPEKRHRIDISVHQAEVIDSYIKKHGFRNSVDIIEKLVEHETQVSN